MSNRRFEMYQYRQVIHRMRMGESDRTIARTRLMGRIKCGQIRAIAGQQGWLDKGLPLPDDEVLVAAFEQKNQHDNPTHQSLSRSYEPQIRQWVRDNVCMTTIHQTLADQFGFAGSYSSVRRLVQGLKLHQPEATCILDFAPGEAVQVDFGKGPDITDAFTGKMFKTWIGEQSKMNVFKVIPKISLLLFKSFFKRLWIKYFFRDFHPLFLLYHLSFILGPFAKH